MYVGLRDQWNFGEHTHPEEFVGGEFTRIFTAPVLNVAEVQTTPEHVAIRGQLDFAEGLQTGFDKVEISGWESWPGHDELCDVGSVLR